jgi:hypothetical protein
METTESPTHSLYSPGQIALASFLGAPIAACWFFAHNYRRLGQPRSAVHCLVWGAVGTVVLFIIAFYLPEHFPSQVIPIGYTVGLLQVAKQTHGVAVADHLSAGGRLGSWWAVVGISLLFLVVILGVIFGVVLLLPDEK